MARRELWNSPNHGQLRSRLCLGKDKPYGFPVLPLLLLATGNKLNKDINDLILFRESEA